MAPIVAAAGGTDSSFVRNKFDQGAPMARVAQTGQKQSPAGTPKGGKKVLVAPPLGGRYARSEGAGSGPERRHNGPKKH